MLQASNGSLFSVLWFFNGEVSNFHWRESGSWRSWEPCRPICLKQWRILLPFFPPGLSGANGGKSVAKGQSGLQRPGTGEVVKVRGAFVVLLQIICLAKISCSVATGRLVGKWKRTEMCWFNDAAKFDTAGHWEKMMVSIYRVLRCSMQVAINIGLWCGSTHFLAVPARVHSHWNWNDKWKCQMVRIRKPGETFPWYLSGLQARRLETLNPGVLAAGDALW